MNAPVSPKIIAAGVAAFLAPIVVEAVYAAVGWLTRNPGSLASLPGWASAAILAAAGATLVVLSGYRTRDPHFTLGVVTEAAREDAANRATMGSSDDPPPPLGERDGPDNDGMTASDNDGRHE